jgi:hypothetical protein
MTSQLENCARFLFLIASTVFVSLVLARIQMRWEVRFRAAATNESCAPPTISPTLPNKMEGPHLLFLLLR